MPKQAVSGSTTVGDQANFRASAETGAREKVVPERAKVSDAKDKVERTMDPYPTRADVRAEYRELLREAQERQLLDEAQARQAASLEGPYAEYLAESLADALGRTMQPAHQVQSVSSTTSTHATDHVAAETQDGAAREVVRKDHLKHVLGFREKYAP